MRISLLALLTSISAQGIARDLTATERDAFTAYAQCTEADSQEVIPADNSKCFIVMGSISQDAGPKIQLIGNNKFSVAGKIFEFGKGLPKLTNSGKTLKIKISGPAPLGQRTLYVQDQRVIGATTQASEACLLKKNPKLKIVESAPVHVNLVDDASALPQLKTYAEQKAKELSESHTEETLTRQKFCAMKRLEAIQSGKWAKYGGDRSKLSGPDLFFGFDERAASQFEVGWSCALSAFDGKDDYEAGPKPGFNLEPATPEQIRDYPQKIRDAYVRKLNQTLEDVRRCERTAELLKIAGYPSSKTLQTRFDKIDATAGR